MCFLVESYRRYTGITKVLQDHAASKIKTLDLIDLANREKAIATYHIILWINCRKVRVSIAVGKVKSLSSGVREAASKAMAFSQKETEAHVDQDIRHCTMLGFWSLVTSWNYDEACMHKCKCKYIHNTHGASWGYVERAAEWSNI